MKKYVYAAITLFLFLGNMLSAQSLEDLKNIQKLKEQLEKKGTLPQVQVKDTLSRAASLEKFKDKVTPPPEIKKSPAAVVPAAAVKEKKLPFFGFDVFNKAQIDYSPEVYGPVDEKYPLGPGDELIISVWGEVELRHELTIDREGRIYIPDVGVVNLLGLNVAKAKKKLTRIMGKSYSSITKDKAFLDISLGKLRSIRVFVVGEVGSPGVFTVPALVTPFNMLFYAGGVRKNGSLRNISLMRGNKVVKNLDFYQFLLQGKDFSDIRLQTHDVILVHQAKKHVHLSGFVKKPAIYELRDGEGLSDVIHFAGGFSANAYIDAIRITRYENNKDHKMITVNYRELLNKGGHLSLKDGDRISVSSIDRDMKNFITISGPVYGPKKFAFHLGMTIKELFAQVDSIGGEAFLERVQITRMLPDRRKQIFSINLKEFLNSADQDLLLAPEDYIQIKSKNVLFPQDSVRIYGAINKSGTYLLEKDMTLKDLIFRAGGFRKDALVSEAEVSRIDPRNASPTHMASILYVPIDSNYTKTLEKDESELFFLEANDNVFIRTNSDWELQRNIRVSGEVVKPGIYSLKNKTERITDIIARAGGLKNTAYLEGATLTRVVNGVGKIGINFDKIFKDKNNEENIYLRGGDIINIPERLATVKVVGGVNFPSSVLFEKGVGLDYYIKAAGGYVELADEKNVTVRLANSKPVQQKRFLFWKYLPEDITAGSTIFVPVLTEKKEIDWSGAIRDAAAILSSVATTILIIDRLKQ